LAGKGLFRAAYLSAIWSKDPKETEIVTEIYNKFSAAPINPDMPLERLFGVFPVDVKRSIIL
jgi:hypothetical protein